MLVIVFLKIQAERLHHNYRMAAIGLSVSTKYLFPKLEQHQCFFKSQTFKIKDIIKAVRMYNIKNLHITKWGNGAIKIVLVHGGVQGTTRPGAAHFSTQEKLAQLGFTLLVPDRPGHGKSPSPNRPDDAEADGELIAELLGDGAHLVGHSFGGCVALAAAFKRPSAVKSLTLIEPGMQALAIDRFPVLWFVLRLIAILKLSFSSENRIKRFSKFMRIPREVGGSALNKEEYVAMGKAVSALKTPSKKTLVRQLSVVNHEGIPFLVVTGGWSKGVDVTGQVVAKMGNGKHVIIPSPHHFPQLISNEFNELLLQFINEVA
jgi:pimeloyl-ACP methyl ester carboxylesterase